MKITLIELELLISKGYYPTINTPTGYEKITDTYRKYGRGVELLFSDRTTLKLASEHRLWKDSIWVYAKDIMVGDTISNKLVMDITYISNQDWIDFSIDAEHESYYHNDILHHNSGKSAIIYSIFRYITEVLGGKCLLIVPTVGLTTQMKSDFKDYSSHNGYDVDENVHLISAGIDKYINKKIVVSTFQSLKGVDRDWLNSFTCIMSDEGHKIQSDSFKTIYDAATEVPYRLACTGTLHDTKCDVLQIQALTGPVREIALAKDLIAAGQLVPLKIKGIILSYPEDICKAFKKVEYEDEIGWITTNKSRDKFIRNLANKCVGTTLILFRFKEHGKNLYSIIKESNTDRKVFFIDGDVKASDREQIRLDGNDEDCIICASYGVFAVGVNLPSIENVIIAHPVKSKLTYLQSIGRGLRLKPGKKFCKLFDIGDNLTYKKKVNTTYKHFGERMGLLTVEGHEFDIVNVKF